MEADRRFTHARMEIGMQAFDVSHTHDPYGVVCRVQAHDGGGTGLLMIDVSRRFPNRLTEFVRGALDLDEAKQLRATIDEFIRENGG